VWRIQEVAEKMLCTEVNFAGSLPLETDIKRSARDLIPAIAKSPNGSYATNLNRIAGNLGLG
jgi:hypothetical protein